MRGRRTYQQRIFIYFVAAFALFAVSIFVFQFIREKRYKTTLLETRLDHVSGITWNYIRHSGMLEKNDFTGLDSLSDLLPDDDVRITVIDISGLVKYDNFVKDYQHMENHLLRPEVQKALHSVTGSNIRHSKTTGQDFFYFTRLFEGYLIRCAVVYDIEVKNFLKTERIFMVFMLGLFLLVGGLVYLVTNRLGNIIKRLRDFAVRAGKNEIIDPSSGFSDHEFDDIQQQIIQIYADLKSTRDELTAERDRLYNHLLALNEGIALFTDKKKKILANSNFTQYINMISDQSSIWPEMFFGIDEVREIVEQVNETLEPDFEISPENLPHFETTLSKNEKYFHIQAIIFQDKSFEILITDITKPEKRRRLKQQLTSNISHELKTPLASIKGYLETILYNRELDTEKTTYFVERAYNQCERLEYLLNDVSLLNKIEEASELFKFSKIKIKPLVNDVVENLAVRLKENNNKVNVSISSKVKVKGNENLLSSVFQNLIDNSVCYAGEGVEISINQYHKDKKFYYFNYSDNGVGIPEEHLKRIFERFYRVDPGRSRDSGGTGLGLAIVKNAIQLHNGDISARNRPEGGVEFLFNLAR